MTSYTDNEKYWIWLSSVEGMTPRRFSRLLAGAGDPTRVWEEPEAGRKYIEPHVYEKLIAARSREYIDSYFELLFAHGICALPRMSDNYPAIMQHVYDAPPTLYVKGAPDLRAQKPLAMVGTRTPGYDGRKAAESFSRELAAEGVAIVSGLARGIDTLCHTGCLAAGGRTLAVLGNGLARVYPPENAYLAQRIVDSGGALISELRPLDPPTRWGFPLRNRIIAGLSRAVFVVEGARTSGAMITAGYALNEGKEVFALPGSPFAPSFEGTNLLIQNGAFPVLSHWDILEGLRWGSRPGSRAISAIKAPELDEKELIIYNSLQKELLSFDELMNVTLFSASELNSCLTMLILRGIIIKLPGNIYRLA